MKRMLDDKECKVILYYLDMIHKSFYFINRELDRIDELTDDECELLLESTNTINDDTSDLSNIIDNLS